MGDFNLETANATPDVLARHTAAEGLRAKGVGEEFIAAHLPLTGDAQRLKAGAEKALARWGEVHPPAPAASPSLSHLSPGQQKLAGGIRLSRSGEAMAAFVAPKPAAPTARA